MIMIDKNALVVALGDAMFADLFGKDYSGLMRALDILDSMPTANMHPQDTDWYENTGWYD